MKYRIQAALVFLAFLAMMVIPFALWPARATIWGALALLIFVVWQRVLLSTRWKRLRAHMATLAASGSRKDH